MLDIYLWAMHAHIYAMYEVTSINQAAWNIVYILDKYH